MISFFKINLFKKVTWKDTSTVSIMKKASNVLDNIWKFRPMCFGEKRLLLKTDIQTTTKPTAWHDQLTWLVYQMLWLPTNCLFLLVSWCALSCRVWRCWVKIIAFDLCSMKIIIQGKKSLERSIPNRRFLAFL